MNRSVFLAPILGLAVVACGGGTASDPAAAGSDVGGIASNPAPTASSPVPTSASISGTVTGLSRSTLLLNNAEDETITVPANGEFSFAKRVTEGNVYNVTVVGQPNGTGCVVTNGVGTIAHDVNSIANVSVSCSDGFAVAFLRFNVGVTVSGLASGNSLTLVNNGNETLAVNRNGLFLFPNVYITAAVYSGRAGGYEVTVKTQPLNQSCTVSNGSGARTNDNNFVDVLVSCR